MLLFNLSQGLRLNLLIDSVNQQNLLKIVRATGGKLECIKKSKSIKNIFKKVSYSMIRSKTSLPMLGLTNFKQILNFNFYFWRLFSDVKRRYLQIFKKN